MSLEVYDRSMVREMFETRCTATTYTTLVPQLMATCISRKYQAIYTLLPWYHGLAPDNTLGMDRCSWRRQILGAQGFLQSHSLQVARSAGSVGPGREHDRAERAQMHLLGFNIQAERSTLLYWILRSY
jgi:hypothetical protein